MTKPVFTPAAHRAAAQAGLLLALAALAAFCVGLLLFILDMRGVATRADQSNRDLRATLIARCEARVAYDQRFVRGAEGDARFYGELLAILQALPVDDEPAVREALEREMASVQDARERKLAIVAEGVITQCEDYEGPL